jgi:hypothetical protein
MERTARLYFSTRPFIDPNMRRPTREIIKRDVSFLHAYTLNKILTQCSGRAVQKQKIKVGEIV